MIPPISEPPRPRPIVAYQGIGSGPGSASRARPPTTKPHTIRPMMKISTDSLWGQVLRAWSCLRTNRMRCRTVNQAVAVRR